MFVYTVIEIRNANHARNARLCSPTTRIASQCQSAGGATMIRAVTRCNLVPSGKESRNPDSILVGFGATVGEKEGIDVPGSELGEFCGKARAHLSCHEWIDIRECRCLFIDGANDSFVAVPDVHAHQLAVEVNKTLTLRSPKIDALGARDRNRINGGLSGPFEECVFAAELDDLLAGQGFIYDFHGFAMLLKSRRFDNRETEDEEKKLAADTRGKTRIRTEPATDRH